MIYVIRAGQSDMVAIGYTTEPMKNLGDLQAGVPEALELVAVLPGGQEEELDVRACLAGHHLQGPWFSLPGYNPESLVKSLLEVNASPRMPSFTDVWKSRTASSAEEVTQEILIGPRDFFPPPTPGLEWAHERYFYPSPKDWMFDVPDGADIGDYRGGFRTTRRLP